MTLEFAEQLLDILDNLKGNGTFSTSGVQDFISPGLRVKGVDNLSFPITKPQATALIKAANKAPFGKGSQTVLDTTVRSAWEIDADNIIFENKKWGSLIESILSQVKTDLGLNEQKVAAHLYKLLIYEKGDFFLPHKDSEKEKGMFGTLIIGLPSVHSGGELLVRFAGTEQKIDFSEMGNDYTLPFAAFYADCEHEIKPLVSGYRICLVYNLVQTTGGEPIRATRIQDTLDEITELLEEQSIQKPIVVMLEHQYTPTNFSLSSLKLNDVSRAQALLGAAEKAGFYAKLGLVTHYLMGDLEYEYNRYSRKKRWSYYDDDDDDLSEGTMGSDIYEKTTDIEHWSADETLPPLRNFDMDAAFLITRTEIGDGEPLEKQAEGYTGNAGMTMEYWYHYGAVILWHKSQHSQLLMTQSAENKLEWLRFYLNNWAEADVAALKKLVVGFSDEDINPRYTDEGDYSVVAQTLLKLNDKTFLLSEDCQVFLGQAFEHIKSKYWLQLLTHFGTTSFETAFKLAIERTKIKVVKRLASILEKILLETDITPELTQFAHQKRALLPFYLRVFDLSSKDNRAAMRKVLSKILALSSRQKEADWLTEMVKVLTRKPNPDYVNDTLVSTLLSEKSYAQLPLAQALAAFCKADLDNRTAIKPTPPPTWARELPKNISSYYKREWDILKDFLESPTQTVFDYRRPQDARSAMASAISNSGADLRMETIKIGSPHTLRLTKTQAAYEHSLKIWQNDVAVLTRLIEAYG
jgi:hypothetical protein